MRGRDVNASPVAVALSMPGRSSEVPCRVLFKEAKNEPDSTDARTYTGASITLKLLEKFEVC
jgi:hypothetical protein